MTSSLSPCRAVLYIVLTMRQGRGWEGRAAENKVHRANARVAADQVVVPLVIRSEQSAVRDDTNEPPSRSEALARPDSAAGGSRGTWQSPPRPWPPPPHGSRRAS